jgi:multiple sugar transport system ATP-binding protein
MARVALNQIRKSFGQVNVLKNIDLEIPNGSFTVLVGPSGCGKSTLLRLIAGLETPTSGTVVIGDKDVTNAEPSDRGISMVFQSYALFPHMTVGQNVEFGIKLAKVPVEERKRRVAQAAEILHLGPLMDRKPAALSGGQRQRVAIGRSIVRHPDVFLFDEPLSNLDANLRTQMRVELADLHQRLAATMVYVTHDQVEAMTLADQIVVLNAGNIEQVGTPTELYERPATEFVATFIGSPRMNLIKGAPAERAGAKTLGVRPEHVAVSARGDWPARLSFVEYLGNEMILYIDTDFGPIIARQPRAVEFSAGENVELSFDPDQFHRFAEDGRRIV